MIEDSIRAVKEAEAAADKQIADAQQQAEDLIRKAEADAEQLLEDAKGDAKKAAAAVMADAKAKGDAMLRRTQEELSLEKEALRSLTEPKTEIAVDRVIEAILQ